MKKIKYIFIVILMFVLTGCGAQVTHNISTNTKEKTIQIDMVVEIDESDYSEIKGGRKKLLSLIEKNRPSDLSFKIDKSNPNILHFNLLVRNYDDYKVKYKQITGIDSVSIFEDVSYSSESPFIAYQNIEFKDDMSLLLNWLSNALIDSGSISQENKDRIIRTQDYRYIFNNENYSYRGEYSYKENIDIKQEKVKIILKQDSKIDILLSLILNKENIGDFQKNYIEYLNSKKENYDLQTKDMVLNNIECKQFDLSLLDIQIDSDISKEKLNSIFGYDFINVESKLEKQDSFFKQDFKQETDINLYFENLFDIKNVFPTEITIDIDGVEFNKENVDHDMPLTTDLNDTGNFKIFLNTTYTQYKFIKIIGLIFVISALIISIRKYGFKESINFLILRIKKCLFTELVDIDQKLINGHDFFISIKHINKITYERKVSIKSLMKISMCFVLGILLQYYEMKFLANIVYIISFVSSIIMIMLFKKRTICIQLTSGKEYFFIFDDVEKEEKVLNQLQEIMQKNNIVYKDEMEEDENE